MNDVLSTAPEEKGEGAECRIPGPGIDCMYAATQVGTWYDTFMLEAAKRVGDVWAKGSATFTYLNVQKPTQMWYHDHV